MPACVAHLARTQEAVMDEVRGQVARSVNVKRGLIRCSCARGSESAPGEPHPPSFSPRRAAVYIPACGRRLANVAQVRGRTGRGVGATLGAQQLDDSSRKHHAGPKGGDAPNNISDL